MRISLLAGAGACLLAVAVAGPAAANQEATAEGTLAAADHGSGAVSYNPAVAPEGAHLSVTIDDADGSTVVALDVEGLLPTRTPTTRWLDLHTDGDGAGHAETEVPFAFTPNRSPRSIVVHEAESTATGAGHAGTAGGRAACLTLPTS